MSADRTLPLAALREDDLAAFETDRDLVDRVFAGEPDEHVTIDVEEPSTFAAAEQPLPVLFADETPGPTEVMQRPPVFVAHDDFPRPSVRVPAPGFSFVPAERESEPRTLTGLHGLHDLLADEPDDMAYLPTEVAPLPPTLQPRARTKTQKLPVPEPSVVVEKSSSIAPLAFDVAPPREMPREIVLRSLLGSTPPPPPEDDGRSNATTVLPRRPVARRSPLFGAAIGLAAALGIAATFAVVMTWRSSTLGARRAAASAPPAATVDAGH